VLEERVAERTDELMAVLELSRGLGSTLELGPLLNLILDRLQSMVPYTGAGILVAEGDRLYQRAHRSALREHEGLCVGYEIAGWHEVRTRLARGEPILMRTHATTHDRQSSGARWSTRRNRRRIARPSGPACGHH
jgi:hypothetical protein